MLLVIKAEQRVQRLVFQQALQRVRGRDAQVRPQRRKLLVQPAEHGGNQVQLVVVVAAQAEEDRVLRLRLVEPRARGFCDAQDRGRVADELHPRARERHALARAREELHAELLLQGADLVADCRLRQRHALGGLGKVQVLRHG